MDVEIEAKIRDISNKPDEKRPEAEIRAQAEREVDQGVEVDK